MNVHITNDTAGYGFMHINSRALFLFSFAVNYWQNRRQRVHLFLAHQSAGKYYNSSDSWNLLSVVQKLSSSAEQDVQGSVLHAISNGS